MSILVYGDFACPLSYQASQQVDRLPPTLASQVIWRAVAATGSEFPVMAYAEAVSDGLHDELRRRLFDAAWVDQRDLGSASEVRRVVARLTWPKPDICRHLGVPDLPLPSTRIADTSRAIRQFGATTVPDFLPVTTALTVTGHRRMNRWRREWLDLPRQDLPAVLHDGELLTGSAAASRIAELADGRMPTTAPAPEPALV